MKKFLSLILSVIMFFTFCDVMPNINVKADSSTNWCWPTSIHSIKSDWPRYSNGNYHSGTDFPVPLNSPVCATCDGEVVNIVSLTTSYGKHIIIKARVNGNTVYMWYCHLNGFNVNVGDRVQAGQVIAYSGSTGNSTGPHLHYEVRNASNAYGNISNPTLNPRDYLPGTTNSFETNSSLGHNPEGCLDSATGGSGTVRLSGWALDRDAPNEAVLLHVYMDGGAGQGQLIGTGVANVSRGDIYGATGVPGDHGFVFDLPVSVTGTHTFYVYAINIGGGNTNTLLNHEREATILQPDAKITGMWLSHITQDGFRAEIDVTNSNGITSLSIGFWSDKDWTDDIVWYTANKYKENHWYADIKASEHNNVYGNYSSDIYLYNGDTIVDVWNGENGNRKTVSFGNFKLNYDANGGSISPESKDVVFNEKYGTLDTPTRSGYQFDGWYTEANGGIRVDENTVHNIFQDTLIYAHWTQTKYKLTIDPNGGVYDGSTSPVTKDVPLIYGEANWWDIQTAERNGYELSGFYTSAYDGTMVYDSNGIAVTGEYFNDRTYVNAGDLTVYAHWVKSNPFSGGSGSKDDPWVIKTADDLRKMSELTNNPLSIDYNCDDYIQINDIDLSGEDFIPISMYFDDISDEKSGFHGTYNGNGKKITGLHINLDEGSTEPASYCGLFGYTNRAEIYDLSVYGEISSTYAECVGGMVGMAANYTGINNCSFYGSVNGEHSVGGFVGKTYLTSLTNCSVNAHITSHSGNAGGFIGTDECAVNISGSYSNSNVSAPNGCAGGLIGMFSTGEGMTSSEKIKNSYIAGSINGSTTGVSVGGKQNAESVCQIEISNVYYLDSLFEENIIGIPEISLYKDELPGIVSKLGSPFIVNLDENNNNGYPIFEWQITPYSFMGSGTESDPYLIRNKSELETMRNLINSPVYGWEYSKYSYSQIADIDLENEKWTPIGKNWKYKQGDIPPYYGHYNGNGYAIYNLNVDENTKFAGLFGCLFSSGIIENLEVHGSVKSTGTSTGGIVGEICNGIVRNCCFFGNVEGSNDAVGGIVGYIWKSGHVQNCYHNGDVTNTSDLSVGGIVGHITIGSECTSDPVVENSYHVGSIFGAGGQSGGIIGFLNLDETDEKTTDVRNCYFVSDSNVVGYNGVGIVCEIFEQKANVLKQLAGELGEMFVTNNSEELNNGYPLLRYQLDVECDVNRDGKFSVADLMVFQKWLLTVPSAHLTNWQSADCYKDGILNVFDLAMMKRLLIEREFDTI